MEQRCAVLAVPCGFSPVPAISCLNVTNMVNIPRLRTAEEAELRSLRATPLCHRNRSEVDEDMKITWVTVAGDSGITY